MDLVKALKAVGPTVECACCLEKVTHVDGRDGWCDACVADFEAQSIQFTEQDDNMSDAEADADALASAGWGTDEDYGYYGGE